eukprot:1950459-Amphidinium_carterae.1
MVYPEAPFQLGPHLRVVRHEDILQCLDCTRITGKVRGEYNFAYISRQPCRKLKKRKQKKRRTGFGAAVAMDTSPANASSQGGALGSAAAASAEVVSGDRHPRGLMSGEPASPLSVPARITGRHMIGASEEPAPRSVWPIFRHSQRAPD